MDTTKVQIISERPSAAVQRQEGVSQNDRSIALNEGRTLTGTEMRGSVRDADQFSRLRKLVATRLIW